MLFLLARMTQVGDLGNLHPDAKGAIPSFKMVLPQPLLTKRVVGRAVIIHNLIDDGGQPTGNAGNVRIGDVGRSAGCAHL